MIARLLFSMFPLIATGEIICQLGPTVDAYRSSADERPTGDVMQLASRVNAAFTPFCLPKCPAVAIFRNATAPNAMLLISDGQAKIVYSPRFFTSVYGSYGDGAILAAIAHEYGHAMDETTPVAWMKRSWNPELRADAWAGCALAKIDLSQTGLSDALTAISKYPPSSRVDWALRLPALRVGYMQCGGDTGKFDRSKAK